MLQLIIFKLGVKYSMDEYECPNIYNKFDQSIDKNVEKIQSIKKLFFNELIYGGHWLALSGSCLVLSIMLILEISLRWELLLIIYFLLQIIYNYDHYRYLEEDSKNNSSRTNHIKKYQKYFHIILVIYSSLFFCLLCIFGNVTIFLFGSFLLALGLLYTIYCKKLTTRLIGFKNFYTSFSISLLVLFVAFYSFYDLSILSIIILFFIFSRLMISTSFCDLKDRDVDKKQNLITLPIYFGTQKFLLFLHILNIISFVTLFLSILIGIAPLFSIFLLPFFLYVFYYIKKAKKPYTDFKSLSSFMVDGEYILWPILLIMGKMAVTVV